MKKIKSLILLMLLCMLCSFAPTPRVVEKFTVDFMVDLQWVNGGKQVTTHEFNYGQKFIVAYAKVKEQDARDGTYFVAPLKSGGKELTISSKSDLVKINEVRTYFNVPAEYDFGIIPVDHCEYLDEFYKVSDICDFSFVDVSTNSDDDESVLFILNEQILCGVKPTATDSTPPSVDNMKPMLENQHGLFVTNVNNPITESVVRSHIKAIDDVDGDITSRIVKGTDTFSGKESKIGKYEIHYSVADKAGNTANLVVHVHVVDTDKPLISGPTEIVSLLSNPTPYQTILSRFKVNDNYDTKNHISINLVDNDVNDYQHNMNKPGDYKIQFSAKDSSNNEANVFTTVVHLKDDVKPQISGTASIKTSPKKKVTLEEVVKGLNVSDNGDPTINKSNLNLVSDTYSSNFRTVGTYNVVYNITDKSGNVSENYTVTINVEDTDAPVFYVDEFIVQCDPSVKLSNEQIFTILKDYNAVDFEKITNVDKQIVITYDNYKNSMEVGTYNMGFKVSYDDGMVQDLTLTINKQILEPVSLPWYTKTYYSIVQYSIAINNYIDSIFNKIYNFFYNLFH